MNLKMIFEKMLFDAVKAESDEKTATAVAYGEHGSPEVDTHWVKAAMGRLEDHFEKDMVKQIRMKCQCGYGMDEKLALVRELMTSSSSLEEFANSEKAKAAGLSYSDGTLFLQFPFCPCPALADVDRLDTDSWCQCTTGYSKVLFEKAFGCAVDVELLKSIKMGDDICLMKIIPYGPIWS